MLDIEQAKRLFQGKRAWKYLFDKAYHYLFSKPFGCNSL